MKTSLVITTLALATLPFIQAACPNKCSGHGSCGANDVCSCQSNWQGGDCSERVCPYVRAWVDTAQYSNDGHYYAECGNRGACDRSTGQCLCDAGYTGSGCRRMSCPNSCSGHGTCEFIEEMASDTDKRIGGTSGVTYTDWDQEKIMGCKCDPGFEGHNCAKRMCPKGDDPLTVTGQSDMKQYIVTDADEAGAEIFLTYYDPYGESWTTGAIATTGTFGTDQGTICGLIQTALRRLPNRVLDTVTVAEHASALYSYTRTTGSNVNTAGVGTTATVSEAHASHWRCAVTFPSTPGTTGKQHLLGCSFAAHSTAGMQPISTGGGTLCNVGEMSSGAGAVAHKLTELATCSNRGVCDAATGSCTCFPGHKGLACEKQEALV